MKRAVSFFCLLLALVAGCAHPRTAASVGVVPDSQDANGRAVMHYRLAFSLVQQGKHERATVECREAIRLDPNLALAHFTLGYALAAQHRFDEGIAETREAMRIDPKLAARVHANLGWILANQGWTLANPAKLDEAIAELREAIRLSPNRYRAHYTLGTILEQQGKHEEAAIELQTAIRLRESPVHDDE
jgi:tetratricopeptide (TPR) repeat protein